MDRPILSYKTNLSIKWWTNHRYTENFVQEFEQMLMQHWLIDTSVLQWNPTHLANGLGFTGSHASEEPYQVACMQCKYLGFNMMQDPITQPTGIAINMGSHMFSAVHPWYPMFYATNSVQRDLPMALLFLEKNDTAARNKPSFQSLFSLNSQCHCGVLRWQFQLVLSTDHEVMFSPANSALAKKCHVEVKSPHLGYELETKRWLKCSPCGA